MHDGENPPNFDPTTLGAPGVSHGGYAFHEDYFAQDSEVLGDPVVLPVHQVTINDYVFGQGYINLASKS